MVITAYEIYTASTAFLGMYVVVNSYAFAVGTSIVWFKENPFQNSTQLLKSSSFKYSVYGLVRVPIVSVRMGVKMLAMMNRLETFSKSH